MKHVLLVTMNRLPAEELDIIRLGLDPDLYPNVDWMDLLLKEGAWQHRVNLNMNGWWKYCTLFCIFQLFGSNRVCITRIARLKGDYNTNADYRRYNYRMNTDIDITKSTLLKLGVSGYLSKRNSPGLGDSDVWGELFGYTPIRTPVLYSNGYVLRRYG